MLDHQRWPGKALAAPDWRAPEAHLDGVRHNAVAERHAGYNYVSLRNKSGHTSTFPVKTTVITSTDVSTHLRPGEAKPVGLKQRWDNPLTASPMTNGSLQAEPTPLVHCAAGRKAARLSALPMNANLRGPMGESSRCFSIIRQKIWR